MGYFVYILYSKKLDRYYIGSSCDPVERLRYHNLELKGWTKRGVPWGIVYTTEFTDRNTAMVKERFIKNQKSRKFIEKLISGEYEL